jgi:hypothetical protein
MVFTSIIPATILVVPFMERALTRLNQKYWIGLRMMGNHLSIFKCNNSLIPYHIKII